MELREAFAKTLRRLRTVSGISQETLALEIGMSRSYIFELESGKANPSLDTIFRLSEGLGVKPSALMVKIEARLK